MKKSGLSSINRKIELFYSYYIFCMLVWNSMTINLYIIAGKGFLFSEYMIVLSKNILSDRQSDLSSWLAGAHDNSRMYWSNNYKFCNIFYKHCWSSKLGYVVTLFFLPPLQFFPNRNSLNNTANTPLKFLKWYNLSNLYRL